MLRSVLNNTPGHSGLLLTKEKATAVIPPELHIFLNVLLNGEEALDTESNASEDAADTEHHAENSEASLLSIGQDIVYAVSRGRKWTPNGFGVTSVNAV